MLDHVTIRVSDRPASRALHATVLRTLGVEQTYDGDELAERAEYHAGYYAAYVLDPDGNNVEVVNQNR